jgi:predicted dehydrogenase
MATLRIGIVGCGEVAQIIHLPTLYQLNDLYEVTALCDVSQTVLNAVGQTWRVDTRLTDYRDLVALDTVDAVLIANPHAHHAEVVLAAIEADKHVLVEKPMCLNLHDNDAIIAAQERTGKVVQVGTMRRYAPAFLEACQMAREMDGIRMARVHDVIGRNALIIEPTSRVIRAHDVPEDVRQATSDLQRRQISAAIGDVSPDLVTAYLVMLGLSTHDLSAMRELLGTPKEVLHAAQRQGGIYITAMFDYGDYVCMFETGIDDIPRFDAFLEVYGADRVIRVDYDTPYVRNLPIRVTVTQTIDGQNTVNATTHPAWGDAFTEEWRAFHDNVVNGKLPKTSPQDFRNDLVMFSDMIQMMIDLID